MNHSLVGIIMGSESDLPVMEGAGEILKNFGVPYEMDIVSAHRTPEKAAAYARSSRTRGLKVIIAAAGGAAHLAGVTAAHTTLPVIGVPIKGKSLDGLDSLLSTVQMPEGVPVATVSINGSKNAAIFAVMILAVSDDKLAVKLSEYKKSLVAKINTQSERIKKENL
jgi:phosphoribosylaminoimidazole carboxylase PurE protein